MSHQHPLPDVATNNDQQIEASAGVLRTGPRESDQVLPIELFFDLVYVLAVTQLTHHLVGHLSVRGVAETLVLFLAVWMGWITVTWITNYFNLRTRSVRVVLIGLALASLIMSASIPEAFDDRGLAFALGFGGVMIGALTFAWASVGRQHALGAVFERVLVWNLAAVSVLVVGALVDGDARLPIWFGGVLGLIVITWLGFPLPRLGHSHTTDYTISGDHMAERCLLFVTIALGELIIITGSDFGELPTSVARWAALVAAFLGSVAIWWTYFDRGADAARQVMSAAEDPGRIGLIAYTYCHMPIVFGIIVAAAGDEVSIAHPTQEVSAEEAALLLGGPALYLLGHILFKFSIWGRISPSRLAGLLAFGAVAPLAIVSSALVLSMAATTILLGVVAWDFIWEHRALPATPPQPAPAPTAPQEVTS